MTRRPAAVPAWSCAPTCSPPQSTTRVRANPDAPLIYLSPRGEPFDQTLARELAAGPGALLLAGRFEGIDERVIAGRRPARGFDRRLRAVGRRACGHGADRRLRASARRASSARRTRSGEESFEAGLLEYPQYTKPREWEGRAIPDVLLSGDHKKIAEWRRAEAERLTAERRPDLARRKAQTNLGEA